MTTTSTSPTAATAAAPPPDPRLRIAVEAPIGWLIVDHPERRNAVSLAMWKALPALVATLEADPDVRVIVLAGGGDQAFVSGADIAEFAEVRRDAASARAYEDVNEAAFASLRTAAKPTVAMIRGPCFGGGVGLAAACDLRVAADDAVFSIPAAKLGIAYPPPAIADVVALVGASRAKDLFFTARRLGHAEALAIGLVDRVVPAADLRTETLALAENHRRQRAPDDRGGEDGDRRRRVSRSRGGHTRSRGGGGVLLLGRFRRGPRCLPRQAGAAVFRPLRIAGLRSR